MLYIVSTPIGNLSDITYRAVESLKGSDYILCEDTRHSLPLLAHYGIQKPLKSYHKFNERAKLDTIINDLKQGLIIALISDAGTPGISDPGAQLIRACINENLPVTAIPGANAAITALCSSGLNTDRFQFWGFLPKKQSELKHALQEILAYPSTTICYESPKRLIEVLKTLHSLSPDREIAVARELTKKFEEVRRGTPQDLINYWSTSPLKGEIVLLISGETVGPADDWHNLSPLEHVDILQSTYNLSKQEAIKVAAKLRGKAKREIYNALHEL